MYEEEGRTTDEEDTSTEYSEDLCMSYNYTELTEEDRNVFRNTSEPCLVYCDSEEEGARSSPDWSGGGWYKFTGGAGDMMADAPPKTEESCCSGVAGWMEGEQCARWGGEKKGLL